MTNKELTDLLDWCACGDNRLARAWLRDTLAGIDTQPDRVQPPCKDGRDWFVLYALDNLGLTEHGTSINYSWLTDTGAEVLEALCKYPDSEQR